jgi:short-subunit dehydrogenase
VITTSSVTAYRGSPTLLDYSATKGAIVAFTRSLAANLAAKNVRVNVQTGRDVPLERAAQPEEISPTTYFSHPTTRPT